MNASLPIVVCALFAHPYLAQVREQVPTRRCPERWTEPKRISTGSSVARNPSIVTLGNTTYVVGNNAQTFNDQVVPAALLTAMRLNGKSIGSPAGHWLFGYPKAFAHDLTGLSLLWAEPPEGAPKPTTTSELLQEKFSSIWTSTYSEPGGWSPPSRVQNVPGVGFLPTLVVYLPNEDVPTRVP